MNAKALSTYMGHANIAVTMDRYGHLMLGAEDQAAALMDRYLAQQGASAEPNAHDAPRVALPRHQLV